MESKWLEFREMRSSNKTRVFYVLNKETENLLGIIKWFGAFRQYSFFPAQNVVFEKTCLKDITVFLIDLMEQRRVKKLTERILSTT